MEDRQNRRFQRATDYGSADCDTAAGASAGRYGLGLPRFYGPLDSWFQELEDTQMKTKRSYTQQFKDEAVRLVVLEVYRPVTYGLARMPQD
ncbi:MAG: hypothetical protein ABIT36_07840 [Steroidobacteraceae bacterium]